MRYGCGGRVLLLFVMPTLVQRPSTGSATAARRRPARWLKILLAAFIAFLLHGILVLLIAWAAPHWHRRPLKKGAAPITLTIQPSEPAASPGLHKTETVPPPQPEYMRTNDDQKADTPPPDPNFISDKDTHAAAEKPAEDPFKPLPTQDGREIAAFDFTTNPYVPGTEAHDSNSVSAPANSTPIPTPPPATTKSPTPPPDPPSPTPGEFLTLKTDSSPSDTPPQPSPSPRPKNSSTPPPVEELLARQAARVARENASVDSRSIQQPPGYQPQSVQSKMSGSVNNRGKASVSALGTPLGRYEKAIGDLIGELWNILVADKLSELIRTENVKIHFYISRAGKVTGLRVKGSNQNTVLAIVSAQAITDSNLPPIPDEVASLLPEGQLEVDYSFGFYEN